jgi:tryptophan 2,3-dioxygenase
MTDHMQTPGLPEEKPAQGCPFPARAGMTRSSIFRSR